jgi:predicted GH43/DUF377 family glycosyl hydrolase
MTLGRNVMFKKLASKLMFTLGILVILIAATPFDELAVTSSPGGWTKYAGNPVLNVNTTGNWDDKEIWSPSVIFDGNMYKMWYTGDRGSIPRRIGYATSPDGISWTRYSSNPVLDLGTTGAWDETAVYFTSVISDTGIYKMWYTGLNAASKNRIGYATSPDGITWTKYAGNPVLNLGATGSWDSSSVASPFVLKVGSIYKMWYRGNGNVRVSIGYATSPDGINWTKYGAGPVLNPSPAGNWDYLVYSSSVIFDGSKYHMWYSGQNYPGTAAEIGYAISTDGINWEKRGRVIPQGPDGSFDRYSADYPAVVLTSGMFKMWYSGYSSADANGYYRIGYASAPLLDLSYTAYLPLASALLHK